MTNILKTLICWLIVVSTTVAQDDTATLQAMINNGAKIPAGVYSIDAVKGLVLKGNSIVNLVGVNLKSIPNDSHKYNILLIKNVDNVTVIGGILIGERNEHIGTIGESGHGIVIRNSKNVVILNTEISDCFGDGVYVGSTSQNITVSRVKCVNNRRQGLTVTSAKGMFIDNCEFRETNGIIPSIGLNIEPNEGDTVENIYISRCKFSNNAGGGLKLGVAAVNAGKSWVRNVKIDDCDIMNNGTKGILKYGLRAIRVDATTISKNRIVANIGCGIADIVTTNSIITENVVTGTLLSEDPLYGSLDKAMFIDRSKNIVVSKNQVTDNYGEGLVIFKSTSAKLNNITINNVKGDSGTLTKP